MYGNRGITEFLITVSPLLLQRSDAPNFSFSLCLPQKIEQYVTVALVASIALVSRDCGIHELMNKKLACPKTERASALPLR